MAVVNNESVPFYQAIHAKKRFRLGTVKTSVAGQQFVYGAGVGSLAAGDFCVFDSGWNSGRLSTSSSGGAIGVSMSANTTSTNYSWFQIGGVTALSANIATSASGIGLGLCASGTAGRATTTAAGGKTLFGAVAVSNPANNLGTAVLNYPTFQNQSTL